MQSSGGATLGMIGSYNSNSRPQLSLIESSIPFIKEGLKNLDIIPSIFPIILADFGSSHGSNSIYIMKLIIDNLKEKVNERSFLIVHNDLSTNDWTTLFNLLNNEEKNYFGCGIGQSFYNQCLPSNCLTIGYSSTSLHWLSKKPSNIKDHCIYFNGQDEEFKLFKSQAYQDYDAFLKNRSSELVQGGILILIIPSVNNEGLSLVENIYNLLYKCAKLVPLTDDELFNYTIPVYFRSFEESCDYELFQKYSFQLIKSDVLKFDFQFNEQLNKGDITLEQFAQIQTGFMRCGTESILKQTLLNNKQRSNEQIEQVINIYWEIYNQQVKLNPDQMKISSYQTYLILKKI